MAELLEHATDIEAIDRTRVHGRAIAGIVGLAIGLPLMYVGGMASRVPGALWIAGQAFRSSRQVVARFFQPEGRWENVYVESLALRLFYQLMIRKPLAEP